MTNNKSDARKTKAQLIKELQALRQEMAESRVSGPESAKSSSSDGHLLRVMFNLLPDHVYFKDQESRFIRISKAQANLFGLESPDDAVGKTDFDFFDKLHAQPAFDDELEVMKTGRVLVKEEKEVWPDGRETWVLTTKAPFPDEDGNITGTFGISRDITELKQIQEILAKRAGELETVARVSAAMSTILDTTELLQEVVNLTKNNFGLYHAHIYVLDEARRSLVLAAGAGEVGRQMVAQGWQISLDQEQSLVARVARMRTGVIVSDVYEDPTWLPNRLLPDTRSEMAVPLLAGERVVGVLDMQSDKVDHFTADDIQIQTSLATQIAVSLENARLFEETQATLAETENLYQANRRINEVSNLGEMMAVIAEISQSPEIDQVYLATFERDSADKVESLTVTASWFGGQGTPPPAIGTGIPLAAIPYKELLFSLEPVLLNDVLQDDRLDFRAVAALQEEHIQSMAILPLWVSNRQIGVLLLRATGVYYFSKAEERLFASLARQVAVAAENRRLLAETQSVVAELEATQRRYTIQAWDNYRRRDVVLSYGQSRDHTNSPVAALPSKIEGPTVSRPANGDPVPDAVDDDTVPEDAQLLAVQNELLVPLKVRDQVIGILGLQEKFNKREWTPEEIDLVEAIAEQVAQAAENLRLIDETQQAAAREARVNEIGEKIQSAQSLEEALRIAVREVGVSLQVPQTAVQLKVVN